MTVLVGIPFLTSFGVAITEISAIPTSVAGIHHTVANWGYGDNTNNGDVIGRVCVCIYIYLERDRCIDI